MNPVNAPSEAASATASTTAENRENPPAPAAHLTEAEFLEEQAARARAAIAEAFADLKTDLAKGADLRPWMKSHPWLTLASAAAAGFVAAAAVVPSKAQQAQSKLHRLQKESRRRESSEHNGNGKAGGKPHGVGLLRTLIHEAFGVLKPAMISLITAYVAPPTPQEPDPAPASDKTS